MSEKPLRTEPLACDITADGHCALCGDVALPARVVNVDDGDCTAVVELESGESGSVATDLIESVQPGDVILVHQSFAIEIVSRRQ